jgi:hypothetical protein
VYEPDRALQQMLNDFIQNYVFIDEDDGKRILHLWDYCYQVLVEILGMLHLF